MDYCFEEKMLTTFQTKIDGLIAQANRNALLQFPNEIVSLIQYTQALDLFDFTAKSYHVQQAEIMVRMSLCWEELGKTKQAIDYCNRALALIPNQPSLILYRSILLITLNFMDEAQKNLLRYKQLGGSNSNIHIFYYDTFRIIFYYVLKYEDEIVLREINEFISKYIQCNVSSRALAAIYFIRASLYSHCALKQKREETREMLVKNYKDNMTQAQHYHKSDASFFLKEGIDTSNLSKCFTMIFPPINEYKPKALVSYKHLFQGFKVFYVLFKAIKLFKLKLKRKQIKSYYIQLLKVSKQTPFKSKEKHAPSQSKEVNALNIQKEGSIGINKLKTNSNSDNTKRSQSKYKTVDEIKREFHDAIKQLYKSAWVVNYPLVPLHHNSTPAFNIHNPINSNYFIRNGYYSTDNLKDAILKGLSHNEDYKSKLNQQQEKRVIVSLKANNRHSTSNGNSSNAKTEPSAPSQISTYSNAKTGDNEDTTKKINHYSIKRLKLSQSPFQLDYHTEMKSHSNERHLNANSRGLNLIDLSDNIDNIHKPSEAKSNQSIIPIGPKHSKIEVASKAKTQPQLSILGLKKNIPQSKTKNNSKDSISKKKIGVFTSNSSADKLIQFRNNQSAQTKCQMSFSKENDQSNGTSFNCLNPNIVQSQMKNEKDDDKGKDKALKQFAGKAKRLSLNGLNQPKSIQSSLKYLKIKDDIVNRRKLNQNNLCIKRKESKESKGLPEQSESMKG